MTRISKFGTRGPRNSSHHGSPSREFFFFFYRVDPSPGRLAEFFWIASIVGSGRVRIGLKVCSFSYRVIGGEPSA